MCQEPGLQRSQERSVRGCTCGSGVEGNRMGMEQKVENTLFAMQNLSSFLLPPSSSLPLYFCISTSVQNFRHLRLPGDSIIFVLRMLIESDKWWFMTGQPAWGAVRSLSASSQTGILFHSHLSSSFASHWSLEQIKLDRCWECIA